MQSISIPGTSEMRSRFDDDGHSPKSTHGLVEIVKGHRRIECVEIPLKSVDSLLKVQG